MENILLDKQVQLDLEAAIANIYRQGTPSRVFHFEHGLEEGQKQSLCERFGLTEDLDKADPYSRLQREIRVHQFLGLEFLRVFPRGIVWKGLPVDTTAAPPSVGPIQSWDDFETYPWPSIEQVDFSDVEWFEQNLPDNIGVWAMSFCFQQVSNLVGFTPLCMMLFENRELVKAVTEKVGTFYRQFQETMCQFSRCAAINLGDDMGHRSATLIGPDDIREIFIPWQKRIIEVAHACEKVAIFHICGQVEAIVDDLIETVGIDAKHSTQDVIEPITVAKQRWGDRVGLLGGIDVDFLTRAHPDDVSPYVRNILDTCMPGGGFALGVGNWVADTIPTENYLAVYAEARSFV